MPVTLNHPFTSHLIDKARVAAIKIEENAPRNQRWIEAWVTCGYMDGEQFVQMVQPYTGAEVMLYVKIENGMHPLATGRLLSKCDVCGAWNSLGDGSPCVVPGCPGIMRAYDGWTRVSTALTAGASVYEEIARVLYTFLLTERVPDPDTWELVTLLDASM